MNTTQITAEHLKQLVERIERLESEKKDIAESIRYIYAESKSHGFEPKIIRQIVKLRAMDASSREELDFLLDSYKNALGL
jgi:uncharacterized protein (UPF0335 family)